MKRVALIHDICGFGKAAMGNIFMILSVSQIEVCQIPTMVLSTHTGGYGRPAIRHLEDYIRECANHYMDNNISFDYIFVGYLGDQKLISEVEYFLDAFPGAAVFFDPIMGDNGTYYSNFNAAYKDSLKHLLRHSDIICPNYTECCLLTEYPIDDNPTNEMILDMCNIINNNKDIKTILDKRIIITSIPTSKCNLGIAVCEKGSLTLLEYPRVGRSYPGTGDTFSAVVLANLASGYNLIDSVKKAHSFVVTCINDSEKQNTPVREGIGLELNLIQLLPKLNK